MTPGAGGAGWFERSHAEAQPAPADTRTADLYRRRHELSRLALDDAGRAELDAVEAELARRLQTRPRRP